MSRGGNIAINILRIMLPRDRLSHEDNPIMAKVDSSASKQEIYRSCYLLEVQYSLLWTFELVSCRVLLVDDAWVIESSMFSLIWAKLRLKLKISRVLLISNARVIKSCILLPI